MTALDYEEPVILCRNQGDPRGFLSRRIVATVIRTWYEKCMPVTYEIDTASRIIPTTCSGQVTIEEVIDHFRELGRDPDCPAHLDVLLDLSGETTIPKPAYLREMVSEIRKLKDKVTFGNCAVAARTDALFGMLRVFAVIAEEYFREICVFRSIGEAETWLASRQHATFSPKRHTGN